MPESALITFSLAFLIPIGYALIAVSGLPVDRARQAAVSFLAALGLALIGYAAAGFAFQFGGIGLIYEQPGLDGLIWEWSALGPTWGPGWGMAGLAGWGLSGAAATTAARGLALANLPWVVTAAAIPLVALRGRIPAWAAGLLGLLMGAVIYPLAGNWIWGGGWLANLGGNLGYGHGLVDAGGGGLVHVLGAAAALAGLLVFLPRTPRPVASAEVLQVPLPETHLPLLALLGAGLLLVGGPAWVAANPLLDRQMLDFGRITLNVYLTAAAGALLPLSYTWLVAGRPDPLMAVRGLAAAFAGGLAAAPFVPAWAALGLGAAVGLLLPFAVYLVDHVLRWDDPTAVLAVHGMGGALGLLALGLFADGTAGLGWAGIGTNEYLGVARQGVTGLLAAAGFQPDWPGQMQAQWVGLAALGLFGFFAAWLCLAPPALLFYWLQPRQTSSDATPAAFPSSTDADAPVAEFPIGLESGIELPG